RAFDQGTTCTGSSGGGRSLLKGPHSRSRAPPKLESELSRPYSGRVPRHMPEQSWPRSEPTLTGRLRGVISISLERSEFRCELAQGLLHLRRCWAPRLRYRLRRHLRKARTSSAPPRAPNRRAPD